MTWRARERKRMPSSVGTTPVRERVKMVISISRSSSDTALERLGCATKSFSAAAVSDPDSATWMTYLSC